MRLKTGIVIRKNRFPISGTRFFVDIKSKISIFD